MKNSLWVSQILQGRLFGSPEAVFSGCTMDSRKVAQHDLFVAIQGEQTDGHQYIAQAFSAGASVVLAEADKVDSNPSLSAVPEGKALIAVQHSIEALQLLAKAWIEERKPMVVGVTGSTGKTTTKDMISDVLAVKYKVHKNKENFNNELGLPLTILNAPDDVDIMVLEMGMRGLGQIQALCKVGYPQVGVITNIGTTHMELLGSQENIAKAKWELIESLPAGGTAVLNAEDCQSVLLAALKNAGIHKLFYGIDGQYHTPDISATDIQPDGPMATVFIAQMQDEQCQVHLPLPGDHHVLDALAAMAVGSIYGISLTDSAGALENLQLSKMRLEILQGIQDSIIINDVYNANPASMKASLGVLAERGGAATIAVLGEMYELGDQAISGHREVGEKAAALGVHQLVTVGKLAEDIARGALEAGMTEKDVFICADCEEAALKVRELIGRMERRAWVLVKGSRGMKMERVSSRLIE